MYMQIPRVRKMNVAPTMKIAGPVAVLSAANGADGAGAAAGAGAAGVSL
jgi:hypothetical protein